uniref:Transporter n=1 Tax=Ascaris lumbricoides TaxID=6252 RepID=A0A0M3IEI4_ASCLU
LNSTFLSRAEVTINRVQVIAAEGEQKASRSLQEAAIVIAESPAALQLRYLQTLNSVAYSGEEFYDNLPTSGGTYSPFYQVNCHRSLISAMLGGQHIHYNRIT